MQDKNPNEFDDYAAMTLARTKPRPVESKHTVSPLQVLAVVAGLLIGVVGGMVLERHWTGAIAEDVK